MNQENSEPTFAGVVRAAQRLSRVMQETPLLHSEPLSKACGAEVWLKLESTSPIGSFKLRGAANALFKSNRFDEVKQAFTTSTGNHGQGVAYAARLLQGDACVYLPKKPNPAKKAKIEALGATVIEAGADFDEAKEAALEGCDRSGGVYVDDGEDPEVMHGAGTVGYEIGSRLDSIDAVLIPMGGGCLAAGSALAIKALHPAARVIGVQSAQAPAMHLSFQAKRSIEAPIATHTECLALGVPPKLNLAQVIQHLDDTRLVEDDELLSATKTMFLRAHQLAEPGSCSGLAALWSARDEFVGNRVVLVVSGANLDEATFQMLTAAPSFF